MNEYTHVSKPLTVFTDGLGNKTYLPPSSKLVLNATIGDEEGKQAVVTYNKKTYICKFDGIKEL